MGDYSLRVTLDDIALQLGVSRSTVSRALHDHPRISKATRRTVKALAAELGYIPNDMARGLRTNQTRMLGFVTQGTSDSYPGDIHVVCKMWLSREATAF